jgi:hypothetical protein
VRQPPATARLLTLAAAGAAVAIALGAYGSAHDPTGEALFTLFFTATINLKAWFATVAIALALFQIATAMRLYGKVKVPREMPSWLGDAHRLSGLLAFLVSLPVAYHCLWALGFETDSGEVRRFVHSVAGCAFYGAFAAKVLGVRSRRLPEWVLPIAGGAAFTSLAIVWATSSLWFFNNVGFPEI